MVDQLSSGSCYDKSAWLILLLHAHMIYMWEVQKF